MKTCFILFLFTATACINAYAQKQNNNWCFGYDIGITFNTTPPSFFPVTLPATAAAVTTVSDKTTGDLLFYTNTIDAYNRNYQLMPNGTNFNTGIVRTPSQGVVIAPFTNDPDKYYIFSVNVIGHNDNGRLSYSIVDMALDGGLGDIVQAKRNITIDSGFSQGITIVRGCNNLWLIAHKRGTGEIYAYSITASGISNTPVISPPQYTPKGNQIMGIKVSPDRMSLAISYQSYISQGLYPADTFSFLALHDFNAFTGKASNGRIIETISGWSSGGFTSCEFSPDSRQLYATAHILKNNAYYTDIYQYDKNLPTPLAIKASKDTIYSAISLVAVGYLQMGPDSNIYATQPNSPLRKNLLSITNANAPFPGCVVNTTAVAFTNTSNFIGFGLPQPVLAPLGGPPGTFITRKDTADCLDKPLILKPTWGSTAFEWQDGSTQGTYSATYPTVYWVRYSNNCGLFVDTFGVAMKLDTMIYKHDRYMCLTNLATLSSTAPLSMDNPHYQWSTGSNTVSTTVSKPGRYWVVMSDKCEVLIDSIDITAVTVTSNILTRDTIICIGDTLHINAAAFPVGAKGSWSNGDTGLVAKVFNKGRYEFKSTLDACSVTDYIDIDQYPAILIELGEDREICADEPLLLPRIVSSEEDDKYRWQNGSSGRSFSVSESGTYYVEVVGHCQTMRDTVNITARPCHLYFPSAFTPNGDGINNIVRLGGDIANVSKYELHIFNRWGTEIFISNDINTGWDGTYKGEPADVATYTYLIKMKYFDKDEIMKGTVILLR